MERVKITKKNKQQQTVSKHFIMQVIMPCVMLACKDTFKLKETPKDQEKLDKLASETQRYIDMIASGAVSDQELKTLMSITDTRRAAAYLKVVEERNTNEKH